MVRVHFLINKLNTEHIIALGGKKSNEKLEKIYGYEKYMGGGNGKILPPPYCSICTSNPSPRSMFA